MCFFVQNRFCFDYFSYFCMSIEAITMDAIRTNHYHLYIDECGDQNLETFSPTFPIFTLCGILVRDDSLSADSPCIESAGCQPGL